MVPPVNLASSDPLLRPLLRLLANPSASSIAIDVHLTALGLVCRRSAISAADAVQLAKRLVEDAARGSHDRLLTLRREAAPSVVRGYYLELEEA